MLVHRNAIYRKIANLRTDPGNLRRFTNLRERTRYLGEDLGSFTQSRYRGGKGMTRTAAPVAVPASEVESSSSMSTLISRRGVRRVFFTNARTTTPRRSFATTYSARAMLSRPLRRIPQSGPVRCLTCGVVFRCRPVRAERREGGDPCRDPALLAYEPVVPYCRINSRFQSPQYVSPYGGT